MAAADTFELETPDRAWERTDAPQLAPQPPAASEALCRRGRRVVGNALLRRRLLLVSPSGWFEFRRHRHRRCAPSLRDRGTCVPRSSSHLSGPDFAQAVRHGFWPGRGWLRARPWPMFVAGWRSSRRAFGAFSVRHKPGAEPKLTPRRDVTTPGELANGDALSRPGLTGPSTPHGVVVRHDPSRRALVPRARRRLARTSRDLNPILSCATCLGTRDSVEGPTTRGPPTADNIALPTVTPGEVS